MAGTAMANIDINAFPPEGAPSLTTTPGEGFDYNFKGGVGLAAPVGTGEVTFQKVKLYPGNYKLTLGGVNNLVVNIRGNGVTGVEGSDKEYTFEVDGNDVVEVTVSMSAKNDSKGFGCTSATLEIVLDAETCSAISSALEKALAEVVPTALNKWNNDADLKSELQDINKKKEDIQGNINKIATNMSLDDYTTFRLWNGVDCTIAAEISKLASKVGTYNEKAATANKHAASEEYYNAVITNVVNKFGQNIKDLEAKIGDNEFLNGVVGEDLEKLQARLDKIKAEFDKARETDSCDRASDSPKNPWQSVSDTWNAIAGKYQAAVADQTAWTKYMSALGDFRVFYSATVDEINKHADVDGEEGDAFAEKRKACLDEVIDLFNKNNSAYNGETLSLGTPAETLNAATAAIAVDGTVRTEISKLADDFKAFVKAQNDAYTAAVKEYETLDGNYKAAIKDVKVPASQKDAYNVLTAAVDKALETFQTYYNGQYGKVGTDETTKTWPGYKAEVDKVKKAIEDLTKAIASYTGINALYEQLQTVQKAIEENGEKLADLKAAPYNFDLVKALGDTKGELDKAIDALEPGQDTKDIKDQIEKYQQAADAVYNALNGAIGKYNTLAGELDAYKKVIADKTVLPNEAAAKAFKAIESNTGLNALETTLKGYQDEITAVTGLTNQECYKAAETLAGKYESWSLDVETAQGSFLQKATQANLAYAKTQVTTAENLVNENKDVTGINNAPISTLTGAIADAETAITAAGTSLEELAKCDETLKGIVADCGIFESEVSLYVSLINKIADVPGQLESAKKVNDSTMDPAKTYFEGVLAGYNTDYNKLVDDLGTALGNALDATKNVAAGKDDKGEVKGFESRVNTLDTNASNVEKTIATNQAAYDELLGISQVVLKNIDDAIAYFKTNCQDEVTQKTNLEKLNALKNTDLAGVDLSMTNDFGKGGLNDAKKNEYQGQYDNISKQVSGLITTFDSEVASINEKTAGDWKTTVIAPLRKAKDDAVKVYNAFYYDITNKGYREHVANALKSHEPLFGYTQDITNLQVAIDEQITKWNTEKYAFSKSEFEDIADKEAAKLMQSINDDKVALINHMNDLGGGYWTEQFDIHQVEYQALYTAMAGAGMFVTDAEGEVVKDEFGNPTLVTLLAGKCKTLEEALTSYNTAVADHEKVQPNGGADYQKQIGYMMNALANLLDNVVYEGNITNLNAAAKILWDANYSKFTTDAAGKLASVDTDTYKFANADQKQTATSAINEQINLAKQFNEQLLNPEEDSQNLIELLPDANTALDGCMTAIDEALAQLAEDNRVGEESAELYKQYKDVLLPSLDTELQALRTFAASLAADSQAKTVEAIAAAQEAYDEIAKFVEEHSADLMLDENPATAKGGMAHAKALIDDAYKATAQAECTVLDGLMSQVRVAFNNAKAAENTGLTEAEAEKYEKNITDAEVALATLRAVQDPKADPDYLSNAQTLEKNLCKYLEELESVYTTETAAADALNSLTNKYIEVSTALDEAKTFLDGCEDAVKDEYAAAYAEIETALGNVKAQLDVAGNQIVALQGNIAAELDAINAEIEAKNSAIKEANDEALAQQAIQANQEALQKQIDGYKAQLDEIRSYLNTYMLDQPDMLGSDIQTVSNLIASLQSQLDAMVEDKTLTADTKFENASEVESAINDLNYRGHIAAVEFVNGLAETAIDAARENLKANMPTDVKAELSAKLSAAIQSRLDAMQAVTDGMTAYESSQMTAMDLETFFAVVEQAISDLTKAENDARAISESVYDNEFTPGDVNLEPDGEVDVTDVQIVMNWVGEGKTYDELLSENPRQAYAADVNGSKSINIADVVAILNIAIEDLNNPKAAPRYLAPDIKLSADNNIALALNGNEDGIREYAVLVNNATTFVAGQLDLKVSAGMEIVDIELTGRAADHELYRFDNSTGARVIVASMSNAALDGNSGALLIVRTRGAGNLEVDGAIFADKHATGFGLGNEGLSGIDSITESCQNVKERIYNVAGQAMNRLQRGINIIRKSDGTTTKEMH